MATGCRGQILVIASNVSLAGSLSVLLATEGYTVHTESCGLSALRYAWKHCPDLVIVDQQIQDLEEGCTCSEVRHHCQVMIVPIILLSPYAPLNDQAPQVIDEADACLPASCEPATLLGVVSSFLS